MPPFQEAAKTPSMLPMFADTVAKPVPYTLVPSLCSEVMPALSLALRATELIAHGTSAPEVEFTAARP